LSAALHVHVGSLLLGVGSAREDDVSEFGTRVSVVTLKTDFKTEIVRWNNYLLVSMTNSFILLTIFLQLCCATRKLLNINEVLLLKKQVLNSNSNFVLLNVNQVNQV